MTQSEQFMQKTYYITGEICISKQVQGTIHKTLIKVGSEALWIHYIHIALIKLIDFIMEFTFIIWFTEWMGICSQKGGWELGWRNAQREDRNIPNLLRQGDIIYYFLPLASRVFDLLS